jgi:hypothetical protein
VFTILQYLLIRCGAPPRYKTTHNTVEMLSSRILKAQSRSGLDANEILILYIVSGYNHTKCTGVQKGGLPTGTDSPSMLRNGTAPV